MAELIAAGTTEVDSSDFTIADGESVTVFLKSGTGGRVVDGAKATVSIKSSGGHYFPVGELNHNAPAQVIQANGTFRVTRHANATSFGVDSV